MTQLLSILYAIRFYAKDIHYACKGDLFYSDHLLADEITDDLDDLIDQINEKMFLGYEQNAPYSKVVMEQTIYLLPPVSADIMTMWKNLYSLLVKAIDKINSLEEEYDDAPLTALMDSVADNIQAKRGLVWRRKLSI